MNSNEKIQVVGTNIGEKANLIWNVANSLFGAYKPCYFTDGCHKAFP